jgi:TolB protein
MNVMGGSLTRLTRTPHAAEASPAWSPDGSRMVFVSDRAGRPQLYVASASGGAMALLTTQGSENVAPDWGTDGRIAYCSKRGAYQIWVADPSGGGSKPVPHDACDHEDPSWAPDNRHIVCTRTAGYRKRLYVLDTEGEPEVALTLPEGDWYSAAWSPK